MVTFPICFSEVLLISLFSSTEAPEEPEEESGEATTIPSLILEEHSGVDPVL